MGEAEPRNPTLRIISRKSSDYRTYFADGAIGAITPSGYLNASFYVERHELPDSLTHEVVEGQLGPVIATEGGTALVRELQCALQLDLRTTIELHTWLGLKIEEFVQRNELLDASQSDSR